MLYTTALFADHQTAGFIQNRKPQIDQFENHFRVPAAQKEKKCLFLWLLYIGVSPNSYQLQGFRSKYWSQYGLKDLGVLGNKKMVC